MNKDFPFALEKGSKKYACPQCGHKRFVRYTLRNGSYVSEFHGRCDREQECGYHTPPNIKLPNVKPVARRVVMERKPSYMEPSLITRCLGHQNNLSSFLMSRYGEARANDAIKKYRVGSATKWDGATVFWQIDHSGDVRAGKIMLYGDGGKRVKGEGGPKVSWVHSELKLPNYSLKQCFFGEHLLKNYNGQMVGIVESEKTAIIASIHNPEVIWLATGGKYGCGLTRRSVIDVLRGMNVKLFPDKGCFVEWAGMAKDVEMGWSVSGKLECDSSVPNGDDIADLLLGLEPDECLSLNK